MSVLFGAQSVATSVLSGVTGFSKTNMTVGAGSNRALVVFISFVSGIDFPGSVSVSWGSQSMTLINSLEGAGEYAKSMGTIQMWGLANPTVGNLTLTGSWATTSDIVVECIYVTGALQTGGTATFAGAASNEDTSGALDVASRAIASAAGDMVVAHFLTSVATFDSVNNTEIFRLPGNGTAFAAGNRAAGVSPTVTMTATMDTFGQDWMAQGVNIVQAPPSTTGRLLDWPTARRRDFLRDILIIADQPLPVSDLPPPINSTIWPEWPLPMGWRVPIHQRGQVGRPLTIQTIVPPDPSTIIQPEWPLPMAWRTPVHQRGQAGRPITIQTIPPPAPNVVSTSVTRNPVVRLRTAHVGFTAPLNLALLAGTPGPGAPASEMLARTGPPRPK